MSQNNILVSSLVCKYLLLLLLLFLLLCILGNLGRQCQHKKLPLESNNAMSQLILQLCFQRPICTLKSRKKLFHEINGCWFPVPVRYSEMPVKNREMESQAVLCSCHSALSSSDCWWRCSLCQILKTAAAFLGKRNNRIMDSSDSNVHKICSKLNSSANPWTFLKKHKKKTLSKHADHHTVALHISCD